MNNIPIISSSPISHAFSQRMPLMPWREQRAIALDQQTSTWQKICALPPLDGPRLAYIHIPFCANHCLFCNFYRNKFKPDDSRRYVDAVIQELSLGQHSGLNGNLPIQALYFGGGTPTALETCDLVRLLNACHEFLPLAPDCEITLEGRIAHFDDNKIDACLKAGVNRISIGVQSFNSKVRQKQGRKATGAEARDFIAQLIARNQAAIVVDLMYGLPYQDAAVWRDDLDTCLDLEPDGIDTYCLSLFPNSPLAHAINNGKLPDVNPLPAQGQFYQIAFDLLNNAGWHQLSNTHWACTTRERNRYNLLIKSGAETLAFGSGAGGNRHGYSYLLDGNLDSYLNTINQGRKPIAQLLKADHLQGLRYWTDQQFERGFIDLSRLQKLPEAQAIPLEYLQPTLQLWQQAGLIEQQQHIIRLTTAGRFWASNLITSFNQQLLTAATAHIPIHNTLIHKETI